MCATLERSILWLWIQVLFLQCVYNTYLTVLAKRKICLTQFKLHGFVLYFMVFLVFCLVFIVAFVM